MRLTKLLYVVICILSIDTINANSGIDSLKKSSKHYISVIKSEFLSIKKKIISPYRIKKNRNEIFLDSLHILSERLDSRRINMFSDLIELDLTSKDIQFFDNLNRESILLYNIIISFGRIYDRYLCYDNINRAYSFDQYTLEMKNLIMLEEKLFSSKFYFANE